MSYTTDRYNLSKLSNQSLAVIECGIQICHPCHAAPKLFYKHYSIHFILEGKGVFTQNGCSYTLQAGQGFLINPNTTCLYVADETEPWKYVYATFKGADDDALVHNAGLDEENVVFQFPLEDETVNNIYAMHRAGKKNEAKGYDVTGYFLLVMSKLVKKAQNNENSHHHSDYYIKRAKQFIEDHYADPISVTDIANHLHIERSYLYRLFMRCEHISPSAYLLNVRTNAAARMLENEELTIGEIAANAGFCNTSHFYKKFTLAFGVTPKRYRERMYPSLKNCNKE